MKIFVDGDGSPVKETVIEVAVEKALDVVIVTSVDHYSLKDYPENVSFVYVDKGADAADFKIVQLIKKGDLLITQDYGLASLVLPKGVLVLHQLGYQYTKENIDGLLEQRYFSGQIRRKGGRTKGPKPFTDQDRTTFIQALIELVKRSL
ncbi:TPA: YaiI/YqxD family protein [Enterococcus faecalis]|nr:YaiI/YqxD family protein [Enterococcus faecalis]HAP3801274.1 YaiI/YqxD family protein [Enterococcus faecalis]HAP3823021.1 YaiI/YqxD family protein [Enterococcus faecalis]HAP3858717.1 YaiI/YqxD family protein [Enterococcus faecalis]